LETGTDPPNCPEESIHLKPNHPTINYDSKPETSHYEMSVLSQGTEYTMLTGASNTVTYWIHWITSYLIVITFIWQSLNVGFLEIIDSEVANTGNRTKEEVELASNIVMTVFQAAHLILVFFVTFKLAKQVLHKTASGSLLAQSYLSTVLLFAGLYTLEYRFYHQAWKFVETKESSNLRPVLLFIRMLYFSTSTATLCGTSLIEPLEWYTGLTVSLQMLTSFVYFASILSMVMIPRKRSQFDPPPGTLRSCTRKLRQCIFREKY